jgi:hypothetical protein
MVMPAVLAALLASGCATIDAPATKLQALRTVGIVSAVGDELTLTKAGLTGLAAEGQRFSIEPWEIDDLIVARVGALLGGRFQVQPVSYRRASFAARDRSSPIAIANMRHDDPIEQQVRSGVAPQGLDAYVVITAATAPYGSRGRTVAGIGIISHDAMLASYAQLHVLYMIRVIDGREFKVIDKRAAAPVGGDEMLRLAGPSRRVDASLLPAAREPADNESLKAAVLDLLERSLAQTLRDLRLVERSGS